jgi:hypothetical protein
MASSQLAEIPQGRIGRRRALSIVRIAYDEHGRDPAERLIAKACAPCYLEIHAPGTK